LKQNYHRIPTGANPTFAHEILKLCLDKGYQMILPLGKMEGQPLNEARVLLEEYGIGVLLPRDLEDCFVLENPSGVVHVLKAGKDILTDDQLCDSHFSGVGMLSDSGEEPILCLVYMMNNEAFSFDKSVYVFEIDDVLYPKRDYLLQVYYLFSNFVEYTEGQSLATEIVDFMKAAFDTEGEKVVLPKTIA